MSAPAKRFRIAFSFAGEKRGFVEEVSALLAEQFGEEAILYDKYHEAEFARARLGRYLPKLYHTESQLVVVVTCPDYESKEWCGLEWDAIFDLLKQRREDEVMLARFGHVLIEGLYSDAGFSELDDKTPEQFVTLILERLALNEGKTKDHYTKPAAVTPPAPTTTIRHNLPALQPFFGREEELRRIAAALDPEDRTWGALIDGPGGMGKTSLAVRAAYAASPDHFQRIVFVSLKTRELDDDGIRDLSGFILTGLVELMNELARELGREDIVKTPEEQRLRLLLEALRRTQALLVLDNLESLTKSERDQLFTFVKRLPAGCKAILTSRGRIGSGAEELILEKLSQEAALETLAELATRNPLLAQTSEAERIVLYQETSGKPLLLRWTAGQIGRGHCLSFSDALTFLRSCPAGNDPLEFIFGDLVEDFTEAETRTLSALTYFTLPAKVEHIAAIAGAGVGRAVASPAGDEDETGDSDVSDEGSLGTTRPTVMTEAEIETALRSLAVRSLAVPDTETRAYTLVPMVADFLRKKKPGVVAETGDRLEKEAYALVLENGYEKHDRFPFLDAAWPTVAAALPRFLAGPSERLETLCESLVGFLNFTGRWDELLAISHDAEAKLALAKDFSNAGWRAYNCGMVHYLRGQSDEVLSCADRAEAHWHAARAGARERAVAIRLRGLGHRLGKNYLSAITALRDAVDLDRALNPESVDVAIGLNALAEAERFSGDLDGAESDFREALRLAEAMKDLEGVATYTGNLARLALNRENWPEAERIAREALALSEGVGRQELIALDSHRLAEALISQGRASEGMPHARRAVEIYEKLGSRYLEEARQILAECAGA